MIDEGTTLSSVREPTSRPDGPDEDGEPMFFVHGTPVYVINGRWSPNKQTATIVEIVESELDEARVYREMGVSRRGMYDFMTALGAAR